MPVDYRDVGAPVLGDVDRRPDLELGVLGDVERVKAGGDTAAVPASEGAVVAR